MNESMTEKKRIQNQLSAGGLRFKMKKCVESFQKQTTDVTFNTQNPQLLPFFVPAGGLWKTFQLSIFVLSRKKSRYQSQLTYGFSFRNLVSFRFYNRRPNCWHIHFFNPLLLQFYPLFSLCKLTYLPPSPKKRFCIVIPWTFSYKQATLSGWGASC